MHSPGHRRTVQHLISSLRGASLLPKDGRSLEGESWCRGGLRAQATGTSSPELSWLATLEQHPVVPRVRTARLIDGARHGTVQVKCCRSLAVVTICRVRLQDTRDQPTKEGQVVWGGWLWWCVRACVRAFVCGFGRAEGVTRWRVGVGGREGGVRDGEGDVMRDSGGVVGRRRRGKEPGDREVIAWLLLVCCTWRHLCYCRWPLSLGHSCGLCLILGRVGFVWRCFAACWPLLV